MLSPGGSQEQMLRAAFALEQQGRTAEAIVGYQQLLDSWPGSPTFGTTWRSCNAGRASTRVLWLPIKKHWKEG